MSDYEHGLEKLGLHGHKPCDRIGGCLKEICGPETSCRCDLPPCDLRQDPAFAWRVLEAFGDARRCPTVEYNFVGRGGQHWRVVWNQGHTSYPKSLSDALYAAVEQLGREG